VSFDSLKTQVLLVARTDLHMLVYTWCTLSPLVQLLTSQTLSLHCVLSTTVVLPYTFRYRHLQLVEGLSSSTVSSPDVVREKKKVCRLGTSEQKYLLATCSRGRSGREARTSLVSDKVPSKQLVLYSVL